VFDADGMHGPDRLGVLRLAQKALNLLEEKLSAIGNRRVSCE
jgi:hypothetical protein